MPDRPWHLAVWMQEFEDCTHKELLFVVSFVCMGCELLDMTTQTLVLVGEDNSDLPISCILRNAHVERGTLLCHGGSVALKQCWACTAVLTCLKSFTHAAGTGLVMD